MMVMNVNVTTTTSLLQVLNGCIISKMIRISNMRCALCSVLLLISQIDDEDNADDDIDDEDNADDGAPCNLKMTLMTKIMPMMMLMMMVMTKTMMMMPATNTLQ